MKKKLLFGLSLLTIALTSLGVSAQERKYPPLSLYIMYREAEIPLAKSAAPASISDHATFKVFTTNGYEVVHQGDNGWVCFVMRGFTGAPTFTPVEFRAIAVYDPKFYRPDLPQPRCSENRYAVLRTSNQISYRGEAPEEIAEEVRKAYAKREIPKRDEVSFAYMWSADQVPGPGEALASVHHGLCPQLREPHVSASIQALEIRF